MLFLSDSVGKFSVDYARLSKDLDRGRSSVGCACPTSTLYSQLVKWLGQIIRNRPQVIWPESDLHNGHAQADGYLSAEMSARLSHQEFAASSELADWHGLFLKSTSRILLETSGSSGLPKQVWHSISTLTQGVKCSSQHRAAVWGLTFPTDHLAGMQVLFQALLNANCLINLYRAPAGEVHHAIDTFSISHLSCTPTFLRMLLAEQQIHPSVQRLTSGGERMDSRVLSRFSQMFPHARLTNIYASTEVGSLLISHDDGFVIPEHLVDQVRVIDGELWLHESLKVENRLGQNEQAGPVAGSESNEFWPTGDQVEIVSQQPTKIRFLSRCHEGFNVAGYRVDPVRLETIARTHPSIADARFYGIPNSVTENLVACDLVTSEGRQPTESGQFQSWLRPLVARHEVPRIVRWVPAIDTTDSGKVRRQ